MKKPEKRILVTGGAGFIGSHLAIQLKNKYSRYEVVALDSLRRRGSELSVPRLKAAGVSFIHGDVRCAEDLEGVGPITSLIECAAEPSVLAGLDADPKSLIHHNLVGTINCLDFARKFKSDFLFLSTSRVYPIALVEKLGFTEDATRFTMNDFQKFPGCSAKGISERFPLEGSRSLYGATKLASELLIEEYRAYFGMKTLINRCGVVAGPWQMGKVDQGFVALWVASHIWKKPLSYIGYGGLGKQTRDILHVEDLFRLVDHEIHHMKELSGGVYNVGGGLENTVSLAEMTSLCRQITRQKIKIESVKETRKADVRMYISDITEISAATGWRPKLSAEAIVQDVYDWMRRHSRQLDPIFR